MSILVTDGTGYIGVAYGLGPAAGGSRCGGSGQFEQQFARGIGACARLAGRAPVLVKDMRGYFAPSVCLTSCRCRVAVHRPQGRR